MPESSAAEIMRLQCLQALGITVYHPRFRLPGAKPSTLLALPEAAPAPPAVAAPLAASPALAPPGRERPASALAETLAEKTPPRETSLGARTATVTTSADTGKAREAPGMPVQNFQLLFLQVDDDLAILNQIPALARPQLQDKQLALLTNLLRWLGKPAPAHTPRMFRWPLPGLESMAAAMSADTSVLHFLEQASTERGFRFLLMLGPQAAAPAAPAWESFATHSLDEMLALPALKREAWQALLPLHARLHAAS